MLFNGKHDIQLIWGCSILRLELQIFRETTLFIKVMIKSFKNIN